MELTKLSTKGQVVIPEKIRKDMEEGTAFLVTRKDDIIILKKVEGLSEEEEKEMEELNRIWKEYSWLLARRPRKPRLWRGNVFR